MSRRFQFSLRVLLGGMAFGAIGWAFWLNLSGLQKLAIVLVAIASVVSNPELFLGLFVEGLAWIVGKIVGYERRDKNRDAK